MRASICVLALVPAAQAFVPLAPAPRRAAPSRLHSAADPLAVSALVAGVAPSKTIEVRGAPRPPENEVAETFARQTSGPSHPD